MPVNLAITWSDCFAHQANSVNFLFRLLLSRADHLHFYHLMSIICYLFGLVSIFLNTFSGIIDNQVGKEVRKAPPRRL